MSNQELPPAEGVAPGDELFEPAYDVPAVRFVMEPDGTSRVEPYTFSSAMTVAQVERINAHSVPGGTPLIIKWSDIEKYKPAPPPERSVVGNWLARVATSAIVRFTPKSYRH